MARVQYSDIVLTPEGRPKKKCPVSIAPVAGTGATASRWAAETGAATLGPIVTDDYGRYSVWLDEGRYDVQPQGSRATRIEVVSEATVGGLSLEVAQALARPSSLTARAAIVGNLAALAGLKPSLETDGQQVPAGAVVLCVGQTDQTDNGLWVVSPGPWARPASFAAGQQVIGATVAILGGTLAGSIYVLTDVEGITVDIDAQHWVNNTVGTLAAAEKVDVVQATTALLTSYQKEQDIPYNLLFYRPDMWRWRADLAAVHARSAQIIAAIKEGAADKISTTKLTTYGPEDFSAPLILGKSSDPVTSYEDEFGDKAPNVHKPAGASESKESSDKGVTIIDAPTGRAVTKGGSVVSVHDACKGPAQSANSKEGAPIPIAGEALVAGGSANESGGPSSSRVEPNALMAVRFTSLYRSDVNWRDAIPHPLRMTIRGPAAKGGAPAGAGMAPRTTSKFAQGVVLEPTDGRLPYVWPARQGEVTGNASSNVDAPPNGCWTALNPAVFTDSFIEALNVPSWVKAVYKALVARGTYAIDVQGQEGVELCRFESLISFAYRGDPYALNWLKAHTDGKWLVEENEPFPHEAFKRWKFDITGGGINTALLFENLRVLNPPPIPSDLQ